MRVFLLLILFLLSSNIFAAKLDITLENKTSIKSFSNLIDNSKNYNLSYITQNSDLSFTLKNINLEKTDNSQMDVSFGIKYTSIENSSKVINSLYIGSLYDFYKNYNYFIPYKAYIKIYNFLKNDVTLIFGRQNYELGNGITLSDNSRGINGIRFELLNKIYCDFIELFYFRDKHPYTNNFENISGLSLNKSFGDGIWQVYILNNKNNNPAKDINFDALKTNKNFYGISYQLDKNKIKYVSEFSIEKGYSNDTLNKKINHHAYSLMVGAKWQTNLPVIGLSSTRLNFLKSSGNRTNTFKENKSFYSPFSKRYIGFERYGLGEIYKASVWDSSKTSNTVSGLPDKLNGLTTINLGFDFPYSKGIFSFDYFNYKATETTDPNLSTFLGSEIDLKYTIDLSKKASFYLIYSVFSPKSAIIQNSKDIKSTKLLSINIKASF